MADNSSPFTAVAGFKGLNNRLDPTALGLQWQLQADNALCDEAGYLVRRPGYAAFLSEVADLHGTKDGRLFVVTSSGSLFEVASDGTYRQRAIGFTGAPFQWSELGYALFAMSETTAWVIYPKRVTAWGIPCLSAPTVAVTSGTFAAGDYAVACILASSDGRLGGCKGVTRSILTANQGLTITSPAVAGYTTRVYLSQPDGALLYAAGTLAGGTLTLSSPPTLGARLETQNIYPPPQGLTIGAFNNRMVVGVWEPEFDRSVLYYSRPDAPHWFALATDYQPVAGRITLLAGVGGSLLIGTDRAIWVETPGVAVQRLANYGALPGTLAWLDTGQAVFWTDNGLALYPPFTNPTDAALYPDNRTLASGAMLYHEGSAYYITAQRGQIRAAPQRAPYTPLTVTTHS
jgi:hypothetical protein